MEKLAPNELNDQIYNEKIFSKKKWFVIVFTVLILSFLLNYPIKSIATNLIDATLKKALKVKGCTISYSTIDLKLFPPKFSLNNLFVPGSCFQNRGSNLQLDYINLSPIGLSFDPIGPRIQIESLLDDNKIEFFAIASFSSQALKFEKTKLKLSSLSVFSKHLKNVDGDFIINGLFKFSNNQISGGSFKVESSNFKVLPINIMNWLTLPSLDIGVVDIQGVIANNKRINLDNIILGDQVSSLAVNFQNGSLSLNPRNMASSTINLKGKVRVSDEIIQKIPLIKLKLPPEKKNQQTGFYPLEITGKLSSPIIK